MSVPQHTREKAARHGGLPKGRGLRLKTGCVVLGKSSLFSEPLLPPPSHGGVLSQPYRLLQDVCTLTGVWMTLWGRSRPNWLSPLSFRALAWLEQQLLQHCPNPLCIMCVHYVQKEQASNSRQGMSDQEDWAAVEKRDSGAGLGNLD